MKIHKLALKTRDYTEDELARLRDSIKKTKHVEPIKTYGGEIVAGRTRYQVARGLGWKDEDFTFVPVRAKTEAELIELIIADEDIRRHNTKDERLRYLVRMYEDRVHTGKGRKKKDDTSITLTEVAKNHRVDKGDLSKAFNVEREAHDSIKELVSEGKLSYAHAATVLDSTLEEQDAIADEIRENEDRFIKTNNPARRAKNQLKVKEQIVIEQPAIPEGKFGTVVIDFPWPVTHAPLPGTEDGLPYPTMSMDEIRDFPIDEVLADDAWVFIWATNESANEVPMLLDYWGILEYRGLLVWEKSTMPGTQWGWRMNAEFLFVARHGNPKFTDLKDFKAVNKWKTGKHSEKPDESYKLIERVTPDGPRLDVFARKERPGWSTWGKEVS